MNQTAVLPFNNQVNSRIRKHEDVLKELRNARSTMENLALSMNEYGMEKELQGLKKYYEKFVLMEIDVECHTGALNASKACIAQIDFGDPMDEMDSALENKPMEVFETELERLQGDLLTTENLEVDKRYKKFVDLINKTSTKGGIPEDEDIIVAQAIISTICPILKERMKDPVKSLSCGHTFSRAGIEGMIGRRDRVACPIPGCRSIILKGQYEVDKEMVKLIRSEERKGKNTQYTQSNTQGGDDEIIDI